MSAGIQRVPRRCARRVAPSAFRRAGAPVLAAALALVTGVALGQAGGGFGIVRYSVDAGGARSSGGGFVLVGTIGQPDAARTQGGAFQLQGGLHRRTAASVPTNALFADGFE